MYWKREPSSREPTAPRNLNTVHHTVDTQLLRGTVEVKRWAYVEEAEGTREAYVEEAWVKPGAYVEEAWEK